MGYVTKIIVGLLLILVGLGLFVDSVYPILGKEGTFGINWLDNFIVVLTGSIPPLLILIGIFIVWLEIDEMKLEKEFREIEEEEKKKKK